MSGLISPDEGLRSHIGGGSGGYLEHVMRYAVSQIHGSSVENLQYKTMRNQDFQEVTVELEGKRPIKMALAYGFRNIQNIVQKIKRGKMTYDFVEIMACPSGCVNGGGQIRPMEGQTNNELLERVKANYNSVACVQPDLWNGVKEVYEDWLGGVDTEKAQAMLHTRYHGVEKTASALNIQW